MEAFLIALLGYLVGPAGALILACLVLYGIYRFASDKAAPIIKQAVDDNKEMIQKIVDSHDKDREVYLASMKTVADKLDTNETKLNEISRDIKDIRKDVEQNARVLGELG